MTACVAIVSGGMDSVTLCYDLQYRGFDVHGLSFNYGQRHKKELDFATRLRSEQVLIEHTIVDLSNINGLLAGSALSSPDVEVPDGLYNEDSMKLTVVPNRNMIMLAIAGGYAVSRQLDFVATGVHAGDHFIYPDCRPEFISAMNKALLVANHGFAAWDNIALIAPYSRMGKHDIVTVGSKIGVPYSDTWSCYKGGTHHCGRCGTCTERKEAFRLAQVIDPTVYEDPIFKVEAYRG